MMFSFINKTRTPADSQPHVAIINSEFNFKLSRWILHVGQNYQSDTCVLEDNKISFSCFRSDNNLCLATLSDLAHTHSRVYSKIIIIID